MKIGFVQFAPALGDLAATIGRIDALRDRIAEADLVVLPELCNSGYNFLSENQARGMAEDLATGPFTAHLMSICREHNLHIVSGVCEKGRDGKLYNSAVLVGPCGLVGSYRKIHLFMNEKDVFEPGDSGLPVFDIGICKVGMLICFDWIFPEVWRVLALKGADIICHPSNLVLPGLAQRAVPIHALTNRVYVITSNRVGTEGDLTFTGMSTIADPRGEQLVLAAETGSAVHIVDVDVALSRDKSITPRNDVFADRRPDQYSDLLDLPM